MTDEPLTLKERLAAYRRQQAIAKAAYEQETGQPYPTPPDISGVTSALQAPVSGSTVSAEHIEAARYHGYEEQAPKRQKVERTPVYSVKDGSMVDEHGRPVFQSQDIYS